LKKKWLLLLLLLIIFVMLSFNPHEAQLMCQAGGEHELDETLATVLVRHKHVAQLDNQLDLL
jgi:hypothetical protein